MNTVGELACFVEDCGVPSTPVWQGENADPVLATLRFWAGRPLLSSPDPVERAVGLQWVGNALFDVGLSVGVDDCDDRLFRSLVDVGLPGGDVDGWLFRWVAHLVACERAHLAARETVLLVPLWCALQQLALASVRAFDLLSSPPSRAFLAFVRNRDGLSAGQAAARAGLSVHQWRYAELSAAVGLDAGLVADVADGFGYDPLHAAERVGAGVPLNVSTDDFTCPHHPREGQWRWEGGLWVFEDHALWPAADRLSLNPFVVSCPAAGCLVRCAVGASSFVLCDIPVLSGSGVRARRADLARHLFDLPRLSR